MYDHVIIIGSSQLACHCANTMGKSGLPIEILDTNDEKSVFLESWCTREGFSSRHIEWGDLTKYLLGISKRTLLVSAFNLYLIPKEVLEKGWITAINCHHAILPERPGRNGATWAIYNQDKEAGITWHYITPKADAGDILCVRKITLDNNLTALQLMRCQHGLACEGFDAIADGLIEGSIESTPQDMSKKGKFRYSYDIPNNGFLDLDWDFSKMSAFLRSMDYGPLKVFGLLHLSHEGKVYEIGSYALLPADGSRCSGIEKENDGFVISTEHGCIRLGKVSVK